MSLQEVPTDDLLSFQDYPIEAVPVHSPGGSNRTVSVPVSQIDVSGNIKTNSAPLDDNMRRSEAPSGSGDVPNDDAPPQKAFWSIEYYQKYFDVDTRDVLERILASITPKWDNSLKHHLRTKPDLYGPFWICVTLIFTIAISGNVASYLQHASTKYHWKYDFHLVSYAATTISLYVTLVPFTLWGLLKWTSISNDIEVLSEDTVTPGALELICIYGYSLFIYIPAAILWSIQIDLLQWLLTLIASLVSGSVLLLTLMPALRLSKQKFILIIGILGAHFLLAAGFMWVFFHVPGTVPQKEIPVHVLSSTTVKSVVANLTGVAVAGKS
ncbi:protein YIPF1 [Anthonomus grandis grandis]|uniref:protein YIPF1 n=1 Tax=Anthonomus grandis grandis TaxID=2921223 RepID=UPI002166A8ED|nr:protein YIPF1 [Anthonomus grandis grandis]